MRHFKYTFAALIIAMAFGSPVRAAGQAPATIYNTVSDVNCAVVLGDNGCAAQPNITIQSVTLGGVTGSASYHWNGASTCTNDGVFCVTPSGATHAYEMKPNSGFGNSYVPTASIAALQAYGSSSPGVSHANVGCYSSSGTCDGGADYDWQAPDATRNNNCTAALGSVYLATGVPATTGCWVVNYQQTSHSKAVNAGAFGANVANANNYTAIQAAVNTGALVYLPGAWAVGSTFCYAVNPQIGLNVIGSGVQAPGIFGDGKLVSQLCPAVGNTTGVLQIGATGSNISNVHIRDIGIIQNGVTTTPYGLIIGSATTEDNLHHLSDVRIYGFAQVGQAGIYLLNGFDDHYEHMTLDHNYYNILRPDVASPEQVTTQWFTGGDTQIENAQGPASVAILGPLANISFIDALFRNNQGNAILWTQSTSSAAWSSPESLDCIRCFFEINNQSNTGTGEIDVTASTSPATNYVPLRVRILDSQFHSQAHTYPQLKFGYVRAVLKDNVGLVGNSGLVTTVNSQVVWKNNELLNASGATQEGTFTSQIGQIFIEDKDWFWGWEYFDGNIPVQFGRGVKGLTSATAPSAGLWGETVSNAVSTPIAVPATGTFGDLAAGFALTVGRWDVTINIGIGGSGVTFTSGCDGGLGTAAGNNGAGLTFGTTDLYIPMVSGMSGTISFHQVVAVASNTTYYPKIRCGYSAGSPTMAGYYTAWRMPS